MKAKMIDLPFGYDMHIHLRLAEILEAVLGFTARSFRGGVVMPNTDPKVCSGPDAVAYLQRILNIRPDFKAIMSIYLTSKTTPEMIATASAMGVKVGKLYPDGVTTGSEGGITDFAALKPVFREMQRVGMILSIHGQMPSKEINPFERERLFLPILVEIAEQYPLLRIVMEHLSTAEAVGVVRDLDENVAATITAHHLVLTMNDVIDSVMQPHNFCLPPAQTAHDRHILCKAAVGGNSKFFFGSDSAPHLRSAKEGPREKGGVCSAPVVMSLLMQVFEECGKLDRLPAFIAKFGPQFYGLDSCQDGKTITMVRRKLVVPLTIPVKGTSDVIIPFMAGQTLRWRQIAA